MRLTPEQAQAIREPIRGCMGQHARVGLFGSRADDSRRGGDVALCVEPEIAPDLMASLQCKSALAELCWKIKRQREREIPSPSAPARWRLARPCCWSRHGLC